MRGPSRVNSTFAVFSVLTSSASFLSASIVVMLERRCTVCFSASASTCVAPNQNCIGNRSHACNVRRADREWHQIYRLLVDPGNIWIWILTLETFLVGKRGNWKTGGAWLAVCTATRLLSNGDTVVSVWWAVGCACMSLHFCGVYGFLPPRAAATPLRAPSSASQCSRCAA